MVSSFDTDSAPSTLNELLAEVEKLRQLDSTLSGNNAILQVLRKHHFWPALQVKRFFHEPNLVLLHNTYKRMDVSHFQSLYDECRSVVLDMSAPGGQNIIVSFADHIPDRFVDGQYNAVMSENDLCSECYEGTVVTVYYHNDRWWFGTSSCPNINSSRFHHPNISHGDMLNDALEKLDIPRAEDLGQRKSLDAVRDDFVRVLDTSKAYAFVLVHYLNRRVIDYTSKLGDKYAALVHIGTRDRSTSTGNHTLENADRPFDKFGVLYPRYFDSPGAALQQLRQDNTLYGIFALADDGRRFKVSRNEVVHREECDLGSPNPWVNMLWLFMQNRHDYHVQDYQLEFAPELELPLDAKNRPMTPTYLIYSVMCNMRDVLYQLYCCTTIYYPSYRRFKMNKEIDRRYHPIIRFHLAQLRHVQVQHHYHAILSKKAVFHYLCFHQTVKNVRSLIRFFAETPGIFFHRQAECFYVLHRLLESKVTKAVTSDPSDLDDSGDIAGPPPSTET